MSRMMVTLTPTTTTKKRRQSLFWRIALLLSAAGVLSTTTAAQAISDQPASDWPTSDWPASDWPTESTATATQALSARAGNLDQGAQVFALNLVLSLSARRLSVYRGEMLVASYEVAVGREGWQTPTGDFSVFQKLTDPTWEHPMTGERVPPGPGNPLGTRWIGFWSDGTNVIGFHGTPDESVMGSAVSHGCVRMRNVDILALYEQVGLATPVSVLP
ncbi:MAG: L,D-transpeptidase [Cyanobacteria bacterium J06597_16]